MSSKRILLVHDDRLLGNLYREKLEGSGFLVDNTRNPDQVPKLVETKKPDLVLIDLVFQTAGGVELVKILRCEGSTMEIPILLFPGSLTQLTSEALQSGATKAIGRTAQPMAAVVDAVKIALGLPGLGGSADTLLFLPDDTWLSSVRENGPENINQMRHCLPSLITTPPDRDVLHNLWALVHGFAERTSLLGDAALTQVANAFDLMLADLNGMPEQINASTLRTIGQCIDFLGILLSASAATAQKGPPPLTLKMAPPAPGILIVDDEPSAREFIATAMQLAGLSTDTAETPEAALEKLNGHPRDLIFLDVGLPGMNGFELCTKIRALDPHKKTPIVFLTGMATFQNKAQASLSGGNDFISKPFHLPELGLKALMWLHRSKLQLL